MAIKQFDKFVEKCCLAIENYVSVIRLPRTEQTLLEPIECDFRLFRYDKARLINAINEQLPIYSGCRDIKAMSVQVRVAHSGDDMQSVVIGISPKIHLVHTV